MLTNLVEVVFEYIRKTRSWAWVAPFAMIATTFVIFQIFAYEYVVWRYQISPSFSLYFRGYFFKVTSLLFVFLTSVFIIINSPLRKTDHPMKSKVRQFFHEHKTTIIVRFFCILLITVVFALGTVYLLPKSVTNIKLVFLTEPDFDKYAFVYIVYELNKRQKYWHFDIKFDEFNENSLTTKQREQYVSHPNKSLWCAKLLAKNEPLIAITTEPLGPDFFFQNQDKVSVISTYKWDEFSPPSVYEYLAYSMLEQSILIHLNSHRKGLPRGAYEVSKSAYGDLFQYVPERMAIKAFILATHLSPKGEQLLLNCFGFAYLRTCSELLTLEWLRSDDVQENLRRCFGVHLSTDTSTNN